MPVRAVVASTVPFREPPLTIPWREIVDLRAGQGGEDSGEACCGRVAGIRLPFIPGRLVIGQSVSIKGGVESRRIPVGAFTCGIGDSPCSSRHRSRTQHVQGSPCPRDTAMLAISPEPLVGATRLPSLSIEPADGHGGGLPGRRARGIDDAKSFRDGIVGGVGEIFARRSGIQDREDLGRAGGNGRIQVRPERFVIGPADRREVAGLAVRARRRIGDGFLRGIEFVGFQHRFPESSYVRTMPGCEAQATFCPCVVAMCTCPFTRSTTVSASNSAETPSWWLAAAVRSVLARRKKTESQYQQQGEHGQHGDKGEAATAGEMGRDHGRKTLIFPRERWTWSV